jgi:cyclic pyranopterin phosphate synthase
MMNTRNQDFSHLDGKGRPQMVDVSAKEESARTATARSVVRLQPDVLKRLAENNHQSPKGPVFQTAILAGTMAAKKTSELIPLCHPIPLEACRIEIRIDGDTDIEIICTCKTSQKTGVEMEALTGASVAALTVYDMCKGLSHGIEIVETVLIEKSGGKRDYKRPGSG